MPTLVNEYFKIHNFYPARKLVASSLGLYTYPWYFKVRVFETGGRLKLPIWNSSSVASWIPILGHYLTSPSRVSPSLRVEIHKRRRRREKIESKMLASDFYQVENCHFQLAGWEIASKLCFGIYNILFSSTNCTGFTSFTSFTHLNVNKRAFFSTDFAILNTFWA